MGDTWTVLCRMLEDSGPWGPSSVAQPVLGRTCNGVEEGRSSARRSREGRGGDRRGSGRGQADNNQFKQSWQEPRC
jgi:hypothetical protein